MDEAIDCVDMLVTPANLPEHPESVPINLLIPIPGTPLANIEPTDRSRLRAPSRSLAS